MDKNKIKDAINATRGIEIYRSILDNRERIEKEEADLNKKAKITNECVRKIGIMVTDIMMKSNVENTENISNDILNMIGEKYYKERW